MTAHVPRLPRPRLVAATGILALALTGCGAASSTAPPSGTASGAASAAASAGSTPASSTPSGSAAAGQVLPVPTDPIANTATAPGLTIGTVLVENNLDPKTKKVTSDHLEIPLTNSLATPLTGVEIFYTFTDKTAGVTENYYAKLPADFTVPAKGTRTVNFDNSGAPDHVPVNKFSVYSTSKNALAVTVKVSAAGVAVQTATLTKDAGGAETAD